MDVEQKKERKRKALSAEELECLSKEELVDKVIQLNASNIQLKGLLSKHLHQSENTINLEEVKTKRRFDFSKHSKRHIALKFLYLGWDYKGLAVQEDTTCTIEHEIFSALYKSCLVEDRQTSQYHRCGRTDKGVSAFCQVISIDVRSNLSQEQINSGDTERELCYPKLLNRLLPEDIRIISWAPKHADFSARFGCRGRTYKYFFPRGNLDIEKMNVASQYLLGSHDFRNLCKMDVKNGVTNFVRDIRFAEVRLSYSDPIGQAAFDVCEFTVTGSGFLWHQVRCLMGILLLVGDGKEEESVVKDLLNIDLHPKKPQYYFAHEVPLNLYHCEFDDNNEVIDNDVLFDVVRSLQHLWAMQAIKTGMLRTMIEGLNGLTTSKVFAQSDCLQGGVKRKIYQPLFERQKCDSLEERIEHYAKKRK